MTRSAAPRRVGIDDVAREAGVSPSTVSRVLNNQPSAVRISASTANRVRHAAARLRYQPNHAARSLRTTQTHTVGVIAHDLVHPFTAQLLRVIYASCHTRGYHILVGNAEHSGSEGRALSDILSADRVDGILLIGDTLQRTARPTDMERLVQTHRPVISVAGRPSVAGEIAVTVDNAAGVTLALEHLASMGHRAIAYVYEGGKPPSWEDEQRRAAYRRFMTAHGWPQGPLLPVQVHNAIEVAQDAVRDMLSRHPRPTAAFAENDVPAILIMKAALMCGVGVPTELSMVGFDDIAFATLCTPGLTTIRQPLEAMGHYAATALLDSIAGREVAPPPADLAAHVGPTSVFRPTLIRRESSGPPAH